MRIRPLVVTAVVLGAVLWPLVRSPQSDGFPLSNYPMFTELRSRVTAIDLAVGVDPEGNDVRLEPAIIGGSIEVIHAASTVEQAVESGTADVLCGEIADRISARGPTSIQSVAIVTDTYDTVTALGADAPAVERTEHARCEVDPT